MRLCVAVMMFPCATVTFASGLGSPTAAKPRYSIKQVMKEAIKGDYALVKKACKGTASAEELAKLLNYFKALRENTPPRGDLNSWHQKTSMLIAAAERVQKDPSNKDLSFQLEQAVECRRCHNQHKPSAK